MASKCVRTSEERIGEPPSYRITAVERLLFTSDLAAIGAFRCPSQHPLFSDSGPVGTPVFVFPRTTVKIIHGNGEEIFGNPNIVMFYNPGQHYRRVAVDGQPDECDWFAVAPEVIAEILTDDCRRPSGRADRPFLRSHANVGATEYLWQRTLTENCEMRCVLSVEEDVLALASRVLRASGESGPPAVTRRTLKIIERAKEVMAADSSHRLSLVEIAREIGCSPYYLSRSFHQVTGLRLYEFRQGLRMRRALELLAVADADVFAVALEIGFATHAHFTAQFRRIFGITPSQYRRSLNRVQRNRFRNHLSKVMAGKAAGRS